MGSEDSSVLKYVCIALAVLLVVVGAYALTLDAEVVEVPGPEVEVPVEVPVEVLVELPIEIDGVVYGSEEVSELLEDVAYYEGLDLDEDLIEELEVGSDLESEVESFIEEEEDFVEDLLVPFLSEEYCTILDEDDVLSVELEDFESDWDADDEEGSFEAELEVKFYCEDDREDYILRDVLLSGEVDDRALEDLDDGDDLDEAVELVLQDA